MFSAGKTYAVCKIGQQVVFIKTGTKHASKSGIELAVFKGFREFLLAIRFFRLRLAVLLGELLDRFSFVHTGVYDAHNKHTINKKK